MGSSSRVISSGASLLLPAITTMTSKPCCLAQANPARRPAPTPTVRPIVSTVAPCRRATLGESSLQPSSTTSTSSTMPRGARRTTSPIFFSSSRTGAIRTTFSPLYIVLALLDPSFSPPLLCQVDDHHARGFVQDLVRASHPLRPVEHLEHGPAQQPLRPGLLPDPVPGRLSIQLYRGLLAHEGEVLDFLSPQVRDHLIVRIERHRRARAHHARQF